MKMSDARPGRSCHHSHPVLKLGNGELVGASGSSPREGFDVYVALDYTGAPARMTWPWNNPDGAVFIHFEIPDGHAPKDPEEFKKLVTFVVSQLRAGKRVHVGCIGGHGRTGTLIAAVVRVLLDEKDAITWVREHHCERGVESSSQVSFLAKHYQIKKQPASRRTSSTSSAAEPSRPVPASALKYTGSAGSLEDFWGRWDKETGEWLGNRTAESDAAGQSSRYAEGIVRGSGSAATIWHKPCISSGNNPETEE